MSYTVAHRKAQQAAPFAEARLIRQSLGSRKTRKQARKQERNK